MSGYPPENLRTSLRRVSRAGLITMAVGAGGVVLLRAVLLGFLVFWIGFAIWGVARYLTARHLPPPRPGDPRW